MQHDPEAWLSNAVWSGTRSPLRSATGLDPAAYASPAFFDLEQQQVFERAWVCVGTADEATTGQMLVRKLGRRSILITRDNDDVLRGFLNTCRHRGTELAEADCAVANTIRCPYHRWGYGLDGTLVATPLFREVPRDDFDTASYGLIPVRVGVWGPLLFACLDPDTPSLDVWLGDLPERMGGYGFESWRTVDRGKVTIGANWKLVTENFQEYYHLNWVHPELAKVSRVGDHYRYQGPGMYCGQTTTPVSSDDRDDWLNLPPAPGLDQSDAVSGRFVAIFPNVILSVLPNHIWAMRLDPVAPGETIETWTMMLPGATGRTTDIDIDATRSFWIDVNTEDIGIVQRGQRGLTAGAGPAGPLAPRFEEPLHRFHNMLADCFTLDSMRQLVVPGGDLAGDEACELGGGTNPSPPAVDLVQHPPK